MKVRKILHADDGKVLTNGTIYGKQIALADTDSEVYYREITEAEYNAIMKEQEEKAYESMGYNIESDD